MANHTNKYCDVATATGEYSCLRVDLVFARELSFYIVTIYVPCFMIVVVSWFSFWLDYKAVRLIRQKPPNIVIDIGTNCQISPIFIFQKVLLEFRNKLQSFLKKIFHAIESTVTCQVPARVSLGVTTLLAMSTTMASIQRSLPPVAYTKVNIFTHIAKI